MLSLTDPDKLYENADKAAEKAKLLSVIMLKVLDDPVVKENIKELALALNDSALKPFLAVALITLKEMQPAIDEAEKELIERLKEGIRRAGDGAWDAFENVIAGVPGIGNAWSAFSALTSAIQAGQTIVQTNLQLILESTYRILGTLRKASVPGLEAVDSFVDFGLNAHNTYTNLTNKFDEINATMQQMKFEPKEGLTKQKIVENMKEQSDSAQAMMPDGLNAAMEPNAKPEEKNFGEENPEEKNFGEDKILRKRILVKKILRKQNLRKQNLRKRNLRKRTLRKRNLRENPLKREVLVKKEKNIKEKLEKEH